MRKKVAERAEATLKATPERPALIDLVSARAAGSTRASAPRRPSSRPRGVAAARRLPLERVRAS
ncbi:MAG: hypothetical protein U0835_18320 [Isosphaeraceae bacterium]